MLPQSNRWATLGAIGVTVLVFVCQTLVRFFGTGEPWPLTSQGWAMLIFPAIVAGLLAALTPNLSVSEAKLGYRRTGPNDAPVLNTASEHLRAVGK